MTSYNNILVIEDSPSDARLVATYLDERFGNRCEVRQARTLADGLSALREAAVDVVLLDLGLPDSQGLDGYREVQRAAPATPIVILTGNDDEDQAMDALRTGAEDYLSKHETDGASLLRAIRHAVQRRQLNDRLRESEARFRAIVETAEEGILQLDPDGQVNYINERARVMLGLEDDPLMGEAEPMSFLDHVRADEARLALALLRTPPGDRVNCELQLTTRGGDVLWVTAAAGGIAHQPGSAPWVVLLLSDIGPQKRVELELQSVKAQLELRVSERTAMLEAANTDLLALSRAMAHDLRSPLNGIIGLTRLVCNEAQDTLATTSWKRLQMVERSALEMNQLISRLLSMSMLSRQQVDREPLDLSAIAQAIADRLDAAEPQRKVQWRIEANVQARGDRSLMVNVMQNLLENAWKYSRTNSVAEIDFGCDRSDGASPVYFVRDNGVGFDMAQAGRLFEAFERMPSSKGHEGTGLGLFGVKRIVRRHGGTVWAESAAGMGSTLRFTLGPDARGG